MIDTDRVTYNDTLTTPVTDTVITTITATDNNRWLTLTLTEWLTLTERLTLKEWLKLTLKEGLLLTLTEWLTDTDTDRMTETETNSRELFRLPKVSSIYIWAMNDIINSMNAPQAATATPTGCSLSADSVAVLGMLVLLLVSTFSAFTATAHLKTRRKM